MTRLIALLFAVLAVAGCGGSDSAGGAGGDGGELTLVAYSTPREVYEVLTKRFTETPAGSGVSFSTSYGASGEQSRAVASGLDADVVAFSLEPDVTRLVDEGLVASDWANDAHKGMVTDSVVVFAVRKGNPKGIRTWDDLLRDDVDIVTPNPFTSGGARWNLMAAYGAQLERGRSHEQAVEYLRGLIGNVVSSDKSARESLQTFMAGRGDVLLAYENEAIFAQDKGQPLDYVLPDETILIENPVAVVAKSENAAKAHAFVDFLRSEEAQQLFADAGYRPVLETVARRADFPEPRHLFTIADLGGWPEVGERFFEGESAIVAQIYRDAGQSAG